MHESFNKHISVGWIKYTHHIRLDSELLCLQAFDCHPLHWKLCPFLILNAVVLLVIYVPCHAEVSHLYCEGFIQPEKRPASFSCSGNASQDLRCAQNGQVNFNLHKFGKSALMSSGGRVCQKRFSQNVVQFIIFILPRSLQMDWPV